MQDPRVIIPKLIPYVQAMSQNGAITKKERDQLTELIKKSISNGYDELIKKLTELNKVMVFMNDMPQMMLDEINGTTRKEDLD